MNTRELYLMINTYVSFTLSWVTHKSFLWAVFHGCCGLFYTIYWLFTTGGGTW